MEYKKLEDLVPTFLTMVLIPLSFSITQGILWGFIAHAVMYILAGRRKEVTALNYALAVVSVGMLWLESSGS